MDTLILVALAKNALIFAASAKEFLICVALSLMDQILAPQAAGFHFYSTIKPSFWCYSTVLYDPTLKFKSLQIISFTNC